MENILPWTLAILKSTPERWTRLAETVPDDLFRLKPVPEHWSALECLHHLVATETVLFSRLRFFLEGEPEFPAYNPDAPENRFDPDQTPDGLAREYVKRRTKSLEALEKIAGENLERTSRHAELGPVTLDQMIHEWAAHDLNHTVQAEQALMQPFLRGCGPWVQYFTAHIID